MGAAVSKDGSEISGTTVFVISIVSGFLRFLSFSAFLRLFCHRDDRKHLRQTPVWRAGALFDVFFILYIIDSYTAHYLESCLMARTHC